MYTPCHESYSLVCAASVPEVNMFEDGTLLNQDKGSLFHCDVLPVLLVHIHIYKCLPGASEKVIYYSALVHSHLLH